MPESKGSVQWRSPWVWANPVAWLILLLGGIAYALIRFTEKMEEVGLVSDDE